MTEHPDPFFDRWAERQRPSLRGHRHAAARIEHAARHDELAAIDAELEVVCARRRAAVCRLGELRTERWPNDANHHHRRRGRVDEVPMPPAPPGAIPLGGVELRATCLGILRRHGDCELRELHGLLHRHGYRMEGARAVQRLADAMAYEVRQGRAVRLARGVYGAVADGRTDLSEPLPWQDPDIDRPQLDPVVLDDPERWSGGKWPDPTDRVDRHRSQVSPPGRYEPSTLDDQLFRARERAAELAEHLRADRLARDAPIDRSAPVGVPGPDERHWDRFVDESAPMVRTWADRKRGWAERAEERARRQANGTANPWLWGDDGGTGGLGSDVGPPG